MSMGGGHDGVQIPYLQRNSGRPFDTDLHDEVSTLRKHSNQGETRRTIQVRTLRLEIVIHVVVRCATLHPRNMTLQVDLF